MESSEMPARLELHVKWLRDEPDGQQFDASGSNLARANLARAYLTGAYLAGAYLADGLKFGDIVYAEIGPLGSRGDRTVLFAYPDGRTEVTTGCFRGSLEDFRGAVARTHAEGSLYRAQYDGAIALFDALIRAKFGAVGQEATQCEP